MKRRITLEQLNELTSEQKQKLRDLWKPTQYDIVYEKSCMNGNIICVEWFDNSDIGYGLDGQSNKEYCLPLLDIGQMIEILLKHQSHLDIEVFHATKVPDKENYIASVSQVLGSFSQNYPVYNNRELCDCLWKAVKTVLI